MAKCIICLENVDPCSQATHLRTKHATPSEGFRFWLDGRPCFADKPSMLAGDLLKAFDGDIFGHFYQDLGNGPFGHPIGHGQAVDLTSEPHFYVLLPATTR